MIELKRGGFFRNGKKISPHDSPELMDMAKISILCEEVSWGEVEQVSSTEKALLEFAAPAGLRIAEINERHPRIKTTLRTEDHHFMATLHMRRNRRKASGPKRKPGGSARHVRHATRRRPKAGAWRAGHLQDRDRKRAHGRRGAARAWICLPDFRAMGRTWTERQVV